MEEIWDDVDSKEDIDSWKEILHIGGDGIVRYGEIQSHRIAIFGVKQIKYAEYCAFLYGVEGVVVGIIYRDGECR